MGQIHGVSGSALENGVAGLIAGIARRAINWLERRPTRLAEWLDRLDAAEELRQLNDRMLDDIGMSRDELTAAGLKQAACRRAAAQAQLRAEAMRKRATYYV